MSVTIFQFPDHEVVEVRPGDQEAATEVDGWLRDYATSRDLALRERAILAYLGLADRLASRYRTSRGTAPEDLLQSARAGRIAAIDRYDPGFGNPFVPYAVACVVGGLKRYLRDTSWWPHVPRPRKSRPCGCPGQPTNSTSAGVAHLPASSWPSTWSWVKRRSWKGWRPRAAGSRCRWTSQSATKATLGSVIWWPTRGP